MAFDPFMASLPGPGAARSVRSIGPATQSGGAANAKESFSAHLEKALESTEQGNKDADVQAEKAAMGDASLHDLAVSMEKADINMRLMMKTRNKLVEAYQEIMRMPV